MIHFITEGGNGNKELKTHRWFLPDGIRHHLEKIKDNNKKEELSKNHTTKEAWDHLVFILGEERGISYNEMKRMKNWFDKNKNAVKTKQYELYGGEIMKTWVENQLNSATLIVKQHKEAQRAMGKKNAFIKAHDADRQNTVTKVDTKVPTYNPLTLNKQNRLKELADIKEHKTVILSEKQKQKLNEVISGKLRTDFFNELETYASVDAYADCVKLCKQYFDAPLHNGSARTVFQMNDNTILKLAYNEKGIPQNKAEVEAYNKTQKYKGLFPIVYSYSPNYVYVIMENVLPLSELNTTSTHEGLPPDDIQQCLGVTPEEFERIISAVECCQSYNSIYINGLREMTIGGKMNLLDFINQHRQQNKNFDLLIAYLFDNPVLAKEAFCVENLGMTQRNGQPWIVILDNGWDGDTAEIYGYTNFGKLNI